MGDEVSKKDSGILVCIGGGGRGSLGGGERWSDEREWDKVDGVVVEVTASVRLGRDESW